MPRVETPEYDHGVLAENLREFRKQLALSQGEMAERLGISKSLYAKLELAMAVTSRRTARRMAETLGTTLDYLLHRTGERVAPSAVPAVDAVPSEEMVRRILELSRREDVIALTKQTANTLKIAPVQACAMIVRTLLQEKRP